MKFTLGVLLIFFSTINLHAARPPDQKTISQYINLALSLDAEKLKGSGPIRCTYVFSNNPVAQDPAFEGRGNTAQIATQALALLCIKSRCQQVGHWIMWGFQQVDQVSDADNIEFLKAQGHTPEEIQNILTNRRTMDRTGISQITCANSSPLAHMLVVDSCFTVPIQCG